MAEQELNAIQKHQLADITRKMEDMRVGFSIINNANNSVIPEALFIRDFLPLFCGESQDNAKELLATWYVIAGSPYRPVDVVDAAGGIIVRIPAILDREALVPNIHGSNLSAVFEEAKQLSYMSPVLGERIINDELTGRFLTGVEATVNPELIAQWDVVFAHYGKKKSGKLETAKASGHNESDFEMD